jgi:hypothetical protein
MLPFYSGSSEYTPKTEFSNVTGLFELSGVSRPENVSAFYSRVIDWLKEFEQQCTSTGKWPGNGITVNFRLTYCNSASTKYIYQLLEIILSWRKYGASPVINWYYDESDDKMRDDGQDLSEALEYEFNYKLL